jgi:transcription initiation factor TFIIB
MATTSLYAACRCSETARPLDDLVAVARVDESAITNAYTVLNRELGLPTPPPSPEAFIPKFVSDLGLGHAVERRAQEILDVAERNQLTNGRNPAGMAGACILITAAEASTVRRPTQQQVADVTGVTPVTLRARRDELLADGDAPPVLGRSHRGRHG